MSSIDLSHLQEYLTAQRWFAGKGMPIRKVELLEAMDLTRQLERPMVLPVAQVTYELGQPELYLVPLTLGPDGGLSDALEDDALALFLFDLVREGQTLPVGAGSLRGEPIGDTGPLRALGEEPRPRRLKVEQSNTSLVFDEKAIFKVIRKLQMGLDPELEMGRFLATRTRFRATPRLLGSLQLEGVVTATVGLLHEFLPNRGDGWSFVTEALQASPTPPSSLLFEVEGMGRQVASLHLALASAPDDPAFAPEPLHQEDLQRWSSSIIGELGVTLAQATRAYPQLAERRDALLERAQRLAHVAPSGMKIRQHGDLHLGQLLNCEQGWALIDFEGEPARSFDQRREKHSPLRDVSGMLRSFTYAAAAAGLAGGARLSAMRFTREFFLKGYRDAMQGSSLLPSTEEALRTLLDALELEKALYEVRYELQTRPGWAHIPVESLLPVDVTS